MATSLGVYEKGLSILSDLKNELSKNIKFLFPICLGIIVAMIFGSKLIIICLNKYYLITMFCFMGMIIGGMKSIINKVYNNFNKKNLVLFLISFFAIILLSIIDIQSNHNNIFTYFLSGIAEAISTIVPGISGTALLMIIGTYNVVMNSFANLLIFGSFMENMIVLFPFSIGLVIGMLTVAKIINVLLKKYRIGTYYSIIGFSFASIVLMFLQTINKTYNSIEIMLSFITFLFGYFIATKIPE